MKQEIDYLSFDNYIIENFKSKIEALYTEQEDNFNHKKFIKTCKKNKAKRKKRKFKY